MYGFVGNSSLNSVDFLGLAYSDFLVQESQWTTLNRAISAAEKIKDSEDRTCYSIDIKRKATSSDALASAKDADVNRTFVFGHGVPTGIPVNKGLAFPRVGSYPGITQEHIDTLKKGGFTPAYFDDHSKSQIWWGIKLDNARTWGIDSVRVLTDGYRITDRQLTKAAEKSGTECSIYGCYIQRRYSLITPVKSMNNMIEDIVNLEQPKCCPEKTNIEIFTDL